MTSDTHNPGGFFAQPKAVWAVAFACVVSFMGIGLVDPILPAIADGPARHAEPGRAAVHELPAVTGVAMLVTSWVSSRIGAKRTLLVGLALIVMFAALAGASNSVGGDRRLPRRLGPRQRAVHRHRARGHRRLGQRRRRRRDHPLRGRARPRHRRRPAARRRARRHQLARAVLRRRRADGDRLRRDRVFSRAGRRSPPAARLARSAPLARCATAACWPAGSRRCFYNFGFFTLLGYTPFPLGLGAHELGLVFFGWGLLVARVRGLRRAAAAGAASATSAASYVDARAVHASCSR